jgi:hypothetical protein
LITRIIFGDEYRSKYFHYALYCSVIRHYWRRIPFYKTSSDIFVHDAVCTCTAMNTVLHTTFRTRTALLYMTHNSSADMKQHSAGWHYISHLVFPFARYGDWRYTTQYLQLRHDTLHPKPG